MPTIFCASCGYLSDRDEATNEPIEVTEEARATCAKSLRYFCFKNSPVFPLRDFSDRKPRDDYWGDFHKFIKCDRWTQYHQGRTPQRHEEMTLLEQVKSENERAQRLARDEAGAAKEEQRRERQAERAERAEDKANAQRIADRTFRVSVISIVVSIIGSIVVNLYLNRDKIAAPAQSSTFAPVAAPMAPPAIAPAAQPQKP